MRPLLSAQLSPRCRWRRLAGIAAALVAAAVLAASAVTWLPRAFDAGAGPTGAADAALAGRSPGPAGRAWINYRVGDGRFLEYSGTEDIKFSEGNRGLSISRYSAARGPELAQRDSGTERIVDGQVYALDRIRGPVWIHEPWEMFGNPKIIDPRRLLRVRLDGVASADPQEFVAKVSHEAQNPDGYDRSGPPPSPGPPA